MRISDWSSDVCSSDLAAEQAIFEMMVLEVGDAVRHIRFARQKGLFPQRPAIAYDAADPLDMRGQFADEQFGTKRRGAQLRMGEPQIIAAFGHMVRKFIGERIYTPDRGVVVSGQKDAGDIRRLPRVEREKGG